MITMAILVDHQACPDALKFVCRCGEDINKAWNECYRSDWMIWLMVHFPCEKYRAEYLELSKWMFENCGSLSRNPYVVEVREIYANPIPPTSTVDRFAIKTVVIGLDRLFYIISDNWYKGEGPSPYYHWHDTLQPWADKIREIIPVYEYP